MKKLFVFLIAAALPSCAVQPTTDELILAAHQCILEYSENGVLLEAPEEFRDECWIEANKRMEEDDRREERRKEREIEAARAQLCRDHGMILACDGWGNCGCIYWRDIWGW